jgi:metal-dependent amidase/aminoacylase/carboxypeptidase family protein
MKLIEPILASNDEIKAIRRDIHQHPELRYEEQRTADLVAAKLTEWGIPIHRGLGKTQHQKRHQQQSYCLTRRHGCVADARI